MTIRTEKRILPAACAFAFACLSYGAADTNLENEIKSYSNPLSSEFLKLREEIVFADASDDSLQNQIYNYEYFFSGDGVRWRHKFENFENIRDFYIDKSSIYLIDSMNPHHLDVESRSSDASNALRLAKTYLFVFDLPEKIGQIQSLEIKRSDDDITLAWSEGDEVFLLTAEKPSLVPKLYERRYDDGALQSRISVTRNGRGFEIKTEEFNSDGTLFCTKTLKAAPSEAPTITAEFVPSKFGFRIVSDTRSGTDRSYLALDKLPSEEFINGLFENPDDVARYNREMSRFSPVKCEDPSHKSKE